MNSGPTKWAPLGPESAIAGMVAGLEDGPGDPDDVATYGSASGETTECLQRKFGPANQGKR